MISRKRRLSWAREAIKEAKRHGVPEGTIRERKNPNPYPSYVALMCDLVDKEPTCFEEETKKKEWVDSMVKEYQCIIKNTVWEIVLRSKDKLVVSLKWIYKTKNLVDNGIEKYKEIFIACRFSQKEGIDYEENFAPVARQTSIRTILSLTSKMK